MTRSTGGRKLHFRRPGDRVGARTRGAFHSDRSLDVGRNNAAVDMPLRNHFGRLARLATLPETRGLIVSTVRSTTLRTIAQRAVEDRAGLLRDLADPANARHLALLAIRHPAVAELASAGLIFLPGRYMPLGWAATWATRRVFRRYIDPQVKAPEEPMIEAGPPPRKRDARVD